MRGNEEEPSQTGSFNSFHSRAREAFSKGKLSEAEALCLRAESIDSKNAGILNLLGQVCLAQARSSEAMAYFSEAIRNSPKRPNLFFNLALAQQAAGQILDAIQSIRTAIEIDASVPVLHAKLGHLLCLAGSPLAALPVLRHALTLDPESVPIRLNLSQALSDLGDVAQAENSAREALLLNGRDPNAHRMLGRVQQLNGNFAEAAKSFSLAISIQPTDVAAYFALAYTKQVGEGDRYLLTQMARLLSSPGIGNADRSLLHYALGKGFDDLGEFASAGEHFVLANQIANEMRGRRYDAAEDALRVDRAIEQFPSSVFTQGVASSSPSCRPIFIVGMIRSGTTLVEQILSRHPEVLPGGEIRYWTSHLPTMLAEMQETSNCVDRWVIGYEAELGRISPSAARITDKMPLNYQALGLIRLAFPNAKVIHCLRERLDTCLSVFVTPYRIAPEFGHDLVDISSAYCQYRRLMDHWKAVLPESSILEVQYEQLVESPEDSIRKLIDFCDLEWNDACLDTTLGASSINTPSQWQARQPMYRRSINRWHNYRHLLEPILYP